MVNFVVSSFKGYWDSFVQLQLILLFLSNIESQCHCNWQTSRLWYIIVVWDMVGIFAA